MLRSISASGSYSSALFALTASNSQSYTDGQVIVSTGKSGSGFVRINANPTDPTTAYIDIIATGSGIYDMLLEARLGNLSGLAGSTYVLGNASPGYGLASQNVFLQGGIIASFGQIANFNISSSYITASNLKLDSSNTGALSLGATLPTSVNSGTGIFLSGSGQALIGNAPDMV